MSASRDDGSPAKLAADRYYAGEKSNIVPTAPLVLELQRQVSDLEKRIARLENLLGCA